ncbi:ganglioside GM2 activator-like isoform X2 [Rhynchophorus ferrugineus]
MVSHVKIQKQNYKLFISGSLETKININNPIKAQLNVKKYIKTLNIWLPVPCIDKMGSCSFDDLCHYGIPNNETCPDDFIKNNVPCRCPIPTGNYTINPDMQVFTIPKKILNRFYTHVPSGTYYIKMSVSNSTSQITCYTFYVDYNNDPNNIDNIDNVILLT